MTHLRLVVLALVAVTPPALSQNATARPTATCWRPRPLEHCRRWIVTEVSVEQPLSSTAAPHTFSGGRGTFEQDDIGSRISFALGAMWNRTPREALGVITTLSTENPNETGPARIEGRYRKWITTRTGADVSLGVTRRTILGDNERDRVSAAGLTASAGVTTTYLGLDGRVDLLHGNGRAVTAALVGVRAGSGAAPALILTGVAGFLGYRALLVKFGG